MEQDFNTIVIKKSKVKYPVYIMYEGLNGPGVMHSFQISFNYLLILQVNLNV